MACCATEYEIRNTLMPPLKVLTINLLDDLSRWEERKNLIAQGVNDLQP
ncbi:MAG: hypothetical protein HZB17_05845, partial [Chloroflexi bacterium]|nr:hypothetical protein [Chloroflexota bacterium]